GFPVDPRRRIRRCGDLGSLSGAVSGGGLFGVRQPGCTAIFRRRSSQRPRQPSSVPPFRTAAEDYLAGRGEPATSNTFFSHRGRPHRRLNNPRLLVKEYTSVAASWKGSSLRSRYLKSPSAISVL